MSTNSAYKCSISKMSLVIGTKETIIPTPGITSIVIDTDYENKTMPIIYVSLSVNLKLYNKLVTNSSNGKIYLNIKKYNVKVKNPVKQDKIKDQFVYFIPSNATYIKDLGNDKDNTDNSSIKITIGLMDMKLLNYKRKRFNTVYRNIDTKNLINIITSGRKLVLTPLEYNTKYDEFLMPPITTRADALNWLFNTNPFYSTMYTYFTDFDRSYLINRKGNYINTSGLNTMFIDIKSIGARSSYYEGITIDDKKGCYILYVNPDDRTITPNKVTEKSVNQIIGVQQNEVTVRNININNSKYSNDTKSVFIRGYAADTEVAKSELESTSVILNFSKSNIDGDLFTPDKAYTVNNYEEDKEYNGRYILIYKKEVIGKMDNEYATNTIIGLRYVGKN